MQVSEFRIPEFGAGAGATGKRRSLINLCGISAFRLGEGERNWIAQAADGAVLGPVWGGGLGLACLEAHNDARTGES